QAVPRRGADPGPIVPGAVPAVVAGDGGHGAAGLGMAGCCAAGFGRVGSWTKRSVVCSDAVVAVAAAAAGEATGGGEAADSDLAVSRAGSPGASPARDSGPSSGTSGSASAASIRSGTRKRRPSAARAQSDGGDEGGGM